MPIIYARIAAGEYLEIKTADRITLSITVTFKTTALSTPLAPPLVSVNVQFAWRKIYTLKKVWLGQPKIWFGRPNHTVKI
jgi:hypothetical protein